MADLRMRVRLCGTCGGVVQPGFTKNSIVWQHVVPTQLSAQVLAEHWHSVQLADGFELNLSDNDGITDETGTVGTF